ncbi:MAG: hypothetical protein QOG10_918 [Kribbellaceae bacterium]|jgi:hypothetical protein|nr:hypothetical protein [Kribbellaceae bacterium]
MTIFSLDFDGILTDHTALDLEVLDHKTFFLAPASATYAPCRPGVRQLAAFLSCFGAVHILSARPAHHHGQMREWLLENAPELAQAPLRSAGTATKAEVAAAEGIALHIDDDPAASERGGLLDETVLIWKNETLVVMLHRLVRVLTSQKAGQVQILGEDVVSMEIIPVTSATPVILVTTDVATYKIRLFDTVRRHAVVEQLHGLLEGTEAGELLPRRFPAPPLCMITTFTRGRMLKDAPELLTTQILSRLAEFLAAVHSHTASSRGECMVTCAVDLFNVCIDDAGKPRIIDIGDCTHGQPWVDVVWSEQLLCFSAEQRTWFAREYVRAAGHAPTEAGIRQSLASFYGHLHSTLMNSKRIHQGDAERRAAIQSIVVNRRVPPTTSALFDLVMEAP